MTATIRSMLQLVLIYGLEFGRDCNVYNVCKERLTERELSSIYYRHVQTYRKHDCMIASTKEMRECVIAVL